MPEKEKKKSSSRAAWERLENRLAQGHELIQAKRDNLNKLETEKEASTTDEERRYLTTSIKAAKFDLEQDELFFQGLEEDKLLVEEELQNDSDTETAEEEVEEANSREKPATERAFTRKEVDDMLKVEVERRMKEEKQDASITATNSRMDRLITALSEARGPTTGPEIREREVPTGAERRRTLGQAPSFVTGESDFITHVESFRDFVELNDINQEDKVKRLFLTTLDQKARMRCAGLEPNRAPCLEMTADAYIARLQEQFVPRATLLIVQQAFHDLRQKPSELATDYLLAKWGHFRRGWSQPNAPFSFYYEAATIGLYDETLRNEVFREIITCADSNDRTEMNAAFQRYLERVQQILAYVRRTSTITNPDGRGLGITGQPTKAPGRSALTNSEVEVVEQMYQDEDEGWYEDEEGEEVGELDEQQIAFAEALEDPRFTELVDQDFYTVGEAETKLCFLCKSPQHLARQCQMRMKNLSSAMGRMGFRPRGQQRGWRGGAQRGWRGSRGSRRGPARGRPAPLSGFPTQLPAPGQTLRPITSAQAGRQRSQDF